MDSMNREKWLTELAKKIEPLFEGHDFPKYRISCSWPSKSALSAKNKRIGECWPAAASEDKTTEIMISLAIDDAPTVSATLVHELVHAVVGTEHGHKTAFKKAAIAVGLEGKMTATHAGDVLTERLNGLLETMPVYPHARITGGSGKKKQGTRLLKAVCECGYTVRITQKWADFGAPKCGQCDILMEMA
jgi:hypothetical protein